MGLKMAMKTFNVGEEVYSKFSKFCKENGINMSRQIEMFMESMVEQEPEAKREYLEKLDKIRNGKFIKINNFAERYGL